MCAAEALQKQAHKSIDAVRPRHFLAQRPTQKCTRDVLHNSNNSTHQSARAAERAAGRAADGRGVEAINPDDYDMVTAAEFALL